MCVCLFVHDCDQIRVGCKGVMCAWVVCACMSESARASEREFISVHVLLPLEMMMIKENSSGAYEGK